ncbi:MAG: TadE family protein [Nocardioidaceae bacterium]
MNPRSARAERATASLELVIVAPIVLLLMMMIIAFGRYSQTESLVDQAARDAARAATAQNNKSEVSSIVGSVVQETMNDAPSSCRDSAHPKAPVYTGRAFELPDITRPTDVATVTITVTCVLDLGDLAALPLQDVRVSRTFTSPLDRYRGYQQ